MKSRVPNSATARSYRSPFYFLSALNQVGTAVVPETISDESQSITGVMRKMVHTIARYLVDHPDDVRVNVIEQRQTTLLELRVAKEDIGKVIGKQGRIAHALRTLVAAVSNKAGKRVVLEIIE